MNFENLKSTHRHPRPRSRPREIPEDDGVRVDWPLTRFLSHRGRLQCRHDWYGERASGFGAGAQFARDVCCVEVLQLILQKYFHRQNSFFKTNLKVTKIDMTPPNVMKETLSVLGKLLRSSGVRKLPLLVQEHKHAVIAAQNFCSERVAPIFRVSSVTGEGLDNLKTFFNLLQPRIPTGKINDPAEFTVDDVFSVPGVGTVVSGT